MSLVPNGLLGPEDTGSEEDGAAADETGTAFPSRDNTACWGSARHIFRCTCSVVLAFFLYLAVIQTQRIDVKFHYQLHFKSYMHIPGHDDTLLCEGPDMIPIDVDSNAFYLQ